MIQNSHGAFNYGSAGSRNGMEGIISSGSTSNFKHFNKSAQVRSRERRDSNNNSQEQRTNIVKNKYAAYRSNISNLNGNDLSNKSYFNIYYAITFKM